jgi:hypothetical protein
VGSFAAVKPTTTITTKQIPHSAMLMAISALKSGLIEITACLDLAIALPLEHPLYRTIRPVERSITVVENGYRIDDQAIIHMARRNASAGIRTTSASGLFNCGIGLACSGSLSTNITSPLIRFAGAHVTF